MQLFEINFEHPSDSAPVGVFLNAESADAAKAKAIETFNADGYEITRVRPIEFAMIPDASAVLYG